METPERWVGRQAGDAYSVSAFARCVLPPIPTSICLGPARSADVSNLGSTLAIGQVFSKSASTRL